MSDVCAYQRGGWMLVGEATDDWDGQDPVDGLNGTTAWIEGPAVEVRQ